MKPGRTKTFTVLSVLKYARHEVDIDSILKKTLIGLTEASASLSSSAISRHSNTDAIMTSDTSA